MDKELFNKLKEDAKERLLKKANEEPKWPYELFDIECGNGWSSLYEPIIDYIGEYNLKQEKEEDKIEIHQIKEKFGGLRIYLSYYTDELRKMIDDAEDKSYNMCEMCGKHIDKPIVENHWIYTECEECYNLRKDRMKFFWERYKIDENSKDES